MREKRDDLDPTASGAYDLGTDHGVRTVITALDQHIGLQQFDQPQGSGFVEEDHTVDAAEGRDYPGAIELGDDGTIGSLPESPHRGVTVEAHHQDRAELARTLKHFDVSRMQQVEHTVGENDRLADTASPGARVGERPDLHGGRTAAAQSASSARGLKRIVKGP